MRLTFKDTYLGSLAGQQVATEPPSHRFQQNLPADSPTTRLRLRFAHPSAQLAIHRLLIEARPAEATLTGAATNSSSSNSDVLGLLALARPSKLQSLPQ